MKPRQGETMKSAMPALVLTFALIQGSFATAADQPPASQASPQPTYKPQLDKDGWEILFDGKDLSAWNVPATGSGWEITDKGELHVSGKGANLFTHRRYCDYLLECDFRVAPDTRGHSGIFLRAHNSADITSTGIEVQIIDDAAYGAKWDSINANGTLYGLVHPTVSASNPVGEWNHFQITVNDALVSIELNGKEIVKADLNQWTKPHRNPDNRTNKYEQAIGALPREGFIGLQNYAGVPVWFRNIRVKPLTDRQPKYTGSEKIEDVVSKAEKKSE
jgi:Domain of Unknown Function (DUF1080)